MKKKMSTFYRVYLIVTASLVSLLLIASLVLWGFLDAYEETRSKYAAETIFEKYFATKNTAQLVEVANVGNGFEDKDVLIEAINKQYEGKEMDLVSVAAGDDGSEKYAVTADGVRVANFTVVKSDKKQKFGLVGYELDSIELFASAGIKKVINVPNGYTLLINGIEVGDKFITGTGVAHYSNEYLPEGEEGLFMTEYTVSGFFNEPQVTVKTEQGEVVLISEDSKTGVLNAELANDTQLQEEYSDYVIKIASTYACVMSEDKTKGELYKYMDKSSEFYQKVKKSAVSWFWDHDGYKIKDEEATRFYRHSDDVFSCRVTLKHEMFLGNKTEVVNLDLVLYLRKIDGKYLLYNALTNG